MLYHLSQAGFRTDTITVEASSKTKILNFFNTYSLSVIRNIKEIVFSKDHKINYVKKEFQSVGRYKKVIITALSENHSKIFTLFNVKKTVTQAQIIIQFKKLLIIDEPIIDFTSILFFHEGDLSPLSINKLYQVQYKRNNKTYVEDFHANSWNDLKELCDTLIDGELTEIRKYVHSSNRVITNTLLNCYSYVSVNMYNDEAKRNFKITNLRHSTNINQLQIDIINTFTLKGFSVDSDKLRLSFK